MQNYSGSVVRHMDVLEAGAHSVRDVPWNAEREAVDRNRIPESRRHPTCESC